VSTWVGLKGEKHKPGESRPSNVWPIQRYIWSDYEAKAGQTLRYKVVPMVKNGDDLVEAPQSEWSVWTDWTTVGTGQTKGFDAYFNRGIVPSQWLALQHPSKTSLQKDIDTKGSKNRDFLSGELRTALLGLLTKAKKDGVKIYAALYELNDPELIDALKEIGGSCYLVLGSGAYKKGEPDENEAVRKELQEHSSVNVYDRLVKSPHFAHNKFVVFCDKGGTPTTLWTGSTNWTVTGLCTQVNNGILVENADIAKAYRARWEELKDAGAFYPPELATSKNTRAGCSMGGCAITAWNTPVLNMIDLDDAKKLIKGARQGVLFLMFNPGPKNTLLNAILELDPNKLFIHGVVNQDPGGKAQPLIKLTHKGKALPAKTLEAILPASLKDANEWFDKRFVFNRVMIHSKVVVVDPFGKHPVVMTGSHNLGPKASGKNDDNLVIIENAKGLAAEYAVNVLGVYGHYKWLYNQSLKAEGASAADKKLSPQYDGNFDDDKWQQWYTKGVNAREIDFWFGP
jgi:phosphatidylserine/phosphatidylglycerophosphate/cardiolipin synthase-like enzyme